MSLNPIKDLANSARQKLRGQNDTKRFALNSAPHDIQSVTRRPTLSLHDLPMRADVLISPPGVWLFEECKRTLPDLSWWSTDSTRQRGGGSWDNQCQCALRRDGRQRQGP